MASYSEVMAEFLASASDYCITAPDNWKQGRTVFGGLTTALLLAAIQNDHSDLPPLRTAQINFVGPAVDTLRVDHRLLRQGKNNVTFEAKLDSAAGAGTYGLFTFGAKRPVTDTLDYAPISIDVLPEGLESFTHNHDLPDFIRNFDRRLISGGLPRSGAGEPEVTTWSRHVDPQAHHGMGPLMVLADTPPAALGYLTKVTNLSSMNWNINMLSDDVSTTDGWYLMRATTQHIKDGFSSQYMEVFNRQGRRLMDGLQHQAVFE